MAKRRDLSDIRQLILDDAPDSVIFVALERRENVSGYWCYFAACPDPEKPREYYWRRNEIDYETVVKCTSAKSFWEKVSPYAWKNWPDALMWVERQFGKWDAVEDLLMHYGLAEEFRQHFIEHFGWKDASLFRILLPQEIEARPKLALEFLKECLIVDPGREEG